MAGIAGNKAAVYQAAQTSVSLSNSPLTDSGDHLTYQITDLTKRFWDDGVAVTVQESTDAGGSWHAAPAGYTVQYVGGKIVYAVARTVGYLYRVSVNYLPITQVARGKKWSADVEINMLSDTEFGSGWETVTPGLGKASGSVNSNWQDGAWLAQSTARTKFVMVLYTDYANARRYECFVQLSKDVLGVEVDGLVEEDLSFTTTGQIYYT